ncbi:MAG: hypothetical protein HRU19_32280 [Pseudobacteriovorax sp.]|nr:hypothetical protein [Pseudobacteriovorax sp.]
MTPEETKKENKDQEHWDQHCFTFSRKDSLSTGTGTGKLEYESKIAQILLDAPNGKEKNIAKVSYHAYTSSGDDRPLFFCFNGGPGAASVWLHVGAFGPKIVNNLDVENYHHGQAIINNENSLLPYGDLVFVDPVGTGFSEVKSEEEQKKFMNEGDDATSLAEFIYRYLDQERCWGRPVFLVGESYGGFRISLLAKTLIDRYSIYPKGLLFVAPFLSGVSIEEKPSNIIAQGNFAVSYAISAWYHGKSSIKAKSIKDTFQQAKDFIRTEWLPALLEKPISEIDEILLKAYGALIGVLPEVLRENQGMFHVLDFSKELFPGEAQYPGRLDSRFLSEHPLSYAPSYVDPALSAIGRSITYKYLEYLSRDFSFQSKIRFEGLSSSVMELWTFKDPFYESALTSLGAAMKQNPTMKSYFIGGHYDLAVTASGIEYDINRLPISSGLRKNIKLDLFEAGHMMYVKQDILAKIVERVSQWFTLKKSLV